MPEERIVRTTYGLGGKDTSKPNNNIIEQVTETISDEQLEAELKDQAREEAIEELTAKKLEEIKAR